MQVISFVNKLVCVVKISFSRETNYIVVEYNKNFSKKLARQLTIAI